VIIMIIIFSQYMRHLYIPLGTYKWRIFELFPVLLGIVTVWIYGALCSAMSATAEEPPERGSACQDSASAHGNDFCHGINLPRHRYCALRCSQVMLVARA